MKVLMPGRARRVVVGSVGLFLAACDYAPLTEPRGDASGMDVIARDGAPGDGAPGDGSTVDVPAVDVPPADACALTMCGAQCVDTQTSPSNCGGCNSACPGVISAVPLCVNGSCSFQCNANSGDCDSNAGNGCEQNLQTSTTHCGACNNACGSSAACVMGVCTPIGPPRLLSPPSTASVTSRQPTFRWVLGSGSDNARVQICRDRACTVAVAEFMGTTNGRPTAELPPGVLFWRVFGRTGTTENATPSPTWEFVVGQRSAGNTTFGSMLDVNGDGIADIAIGAPYGTPGTNNQAGLVRIYHGGTAATGPSSTVNRQLVGVGASDNFGWSVSSAGDVNGDGFGDLVVGAPGYNPTTMLPDAGLVHVYLGSASGLSATPDVAINGKEANLGLGFSVASAGDVNGDGYGDIVVGGIGPARDRIQAGRGQGYAAIYLGGATGLSRMPVVDFRGALDQDYLGWSVAGAGDLNNDGFSDVLIGVPGRDSRGPVLFLSDIGGVLVIHGTAAGGARTPSVQFSGTINSAFGIAVAGAGDMNGDGFLEMIVGANTSQSNNMANAGRAYIYRGTATGLDGMNPRILEGSTSAEANVGSNFGSSVAGGGDVNSDGFSDVIIGSPQADPGGVAGAGRVSIFTGSTTGGSSVPTVINYNITGGLMGLKVSMPGDVNQDGFGDVLVGVPGFNQGPNTNAGAGFLYRGTGAGVSTSLYRVFTGMFANENLGYSLALRSPSRLRTRTLACNERECSRPARATSTSTSRTHGARRVPSRPL